ncbi:unnamed protein product [Brassica oleracea]
MRKEKCKTLFLLFLERDNDLNVLCVDVSNTFDFAQKQFRFQEWVLDVDEESNGCGGGEMEIEGIQTRTVEARTRGLVPVWGYLQSSKPQQVMRESFQSPRNTTQGDQVTPLEGHGTGTEFGVVHGKEENLRSEEESVRSEEADLPETGSTSRFCVTSIISQVREAQLAQYNYILVVGESEASTGQVSVRIRDSAVHSVKSIEDLLEEFKTKTAEYQ